MSPAAEGPDGSGTILSGPPPSGGTVRRALSAVAACLLVWFVAAAPDDFRAWSFTAFLLPPATLLLLLGAALLPARWGRVLAMGVGVLLGTVFLLKALDLGFRATLGRPFSVVDDWSYLAAGADVLVQLAGPGWGAATVIGAVLVAAAVLVLVPLACRRLVRLAASRLRPTVAVVAGIIASFVAIAAVGGGAPGVQAAADGSVRDVDLVARTLAAVPGDLSDRAAFASEIRADPFADVPAGRRLAGLAGRDVLIVFVESFGRVALEDPVASPTVRGALVELGETLAASGFTARSAWLDSPTFGGASWLAHSTVQSGLRVDTERRYNQLLTSDRLTLTRAFGEAGWRTVFDLPAMDRPWPQGLPFYRFDFIHTSLNVGYHGARYGYAPVPDQFTLDHFAATELGTGPRKAVMAEIDLVSSHYPWTPPPPLLEWGRLGDGSSFVGPASAPATTDPKQAYAEAVAYSLRSLAGFVAHSDDPNLVILALGDHQPNNSVTADDSDHQVPVMLIAKDPEVFARTAGWGWGEGAAPGDGAPVWPMGEVRDRVFRAFEGDH